MTSKENYLRLLSGEMPEWVPAYTYGPQPEQFEPPATGRINTPFLSGNRTPQGGKDIWGVEWVPTYEMGNAALPKPGNFILTDIRKWRDVIKAPDLSGIDWEAMGKRDLENCPVDRSQTALAFGTHFGYFQTVMSFMGFTEGLCAMYEEPEEVKALMNYLCDFYTTVTEKLIDIYKPDVLALTDDTAAEKSPFISPEMYAEFLLPLYDRHAKFARDRGIPISMHNCGHCEVFFDDLVKIGVVSWDPVQLSNDIEGVQAKFGRKLVICGGWEARGRLLEDDVTDEELVESVRTAMNKYAKNGGYMIIGGGFLGPPDNKAAQRRSQVVRKAIYDIGHAFYKH